MLSQEGTAKRSACGEKASAEMPSGGGAATYNEKVILSIRYITFLLYAIYFEIGCFHSMFFYLFEKSKREKFNF